MTLRGIQGDMALAPSTGAPAKGNDRELAEHRRAWEREMERAQMSAWLAHGPLKAGAGADFPNLRAQAGAAETTVPGAERSAHSRDMTPHMPLREREDAVAEPVDAGDPYSVPETAREAHRSAPPHVEARREALRSFVQDRSAGPWVPDPVSSEHPLRVGHPAAARLSSLEGQPHHAISSLHPAYGHVFGQAATPAAAAGGVASDEADATEIDAAPTAVPEVFTRIAAEPAPVEPQADPTPVVSAAETPMVPPRRPEVDVREQTESLAKALRIHGPVSATFAPTGDVSAAVQGPSSASANVAAKDRIVPSPAARTAAVPSQAAPTFVPARPASAMPGNVMPALVMPGQDAIAGDLTPGLPARADLRAPAQARHVPASAARQALGAPSSPPIRVHADWSADGVRLWLGLDEPLQGQMAAIADQVRQWVRGQGTRLLSFTCNGRLLSGEHEPISEPDEPASIQARFEPREKKTWPSVR